MVPESARILLFTLAVATLAAPRMALAQGSELAGSVSTHGLRASAPALDDVSTLDGIIRAFYQVVSGPAGEAPDRSRDERLHMPGAVIGLGQVGADGRPVLQTMDLAGYYQRYGGRRAQPFYEWEVHRETHQFGSIAQVWSTYVTSDEIGGRPTGRGINSMQLHYDGSRWWIAAWLDERERAAQPIPERYGGSGFDALGYVDSAVAIIREHALTSRGVDWVATARQARRMAAPGHPVDAYEAVAFVISQLGDNHSNLRPASEHSAQYFARLRERLRAPEPRPEIDTTFSRRRDPAATDLEGPRSVVRWVVVPRFAGAAEAAQALADNLYGMVTGGPVACGYVIDFRGNGGGNMWPMLAGLSPLLGNGDVGAFVFANERVTIFHRDGVVGTREEGGEQVIQRVAAWSPAAALENVPLAVLIDSGAASSGEITPIMLAGRPNTRFFGTPTAGIATAIRPYPLPDGATLMLTVADVSDRTGRTYRSGLHPDEDVPNSDPGTGIDRPLQAAGAWLMSQGCR
jgi:carboxyl-terminal processing protease